MKLSICIIDEDSIRAETIKETLLDEDYHVEAFTSVDFGIKALVEGRFDVVFIDPNVTDDSTQLVNKIKSLASNTKIVALISSAKADTILHLSELGIHHFIETPIHSINSSWGSSFFGQSIAWFFLRSSGWAESPLLRGRCGWA